MNIDNPIEFQDLTKVVITLLKGRGMTKVSNLLENGCLKIFNKDDNTWFDGTITYYLLLIVPIECYSQYAKSTIEFAEQQIVETINEVTKTDSTLRFDTKITPSLEEDSTLPELPINSEYAVIKQEIERIQEIMIDVATGGPKIHTVDPEYQDLHRTVRSQCETYEIPYDNSFNSLWDWYHKWAEDFPHWQQRRVYIRNLLGVTLSFLEEKQSNDNSNLLIQLEDWDIINRRIRKIHRSSKTAKDVEDFQAIGMMCREVLISLGQTVYNPTLHDQEDESGKMIGDADTVRMISAYLKVKLQGKHNKEYRDYAKTTNNIANQLTHKRTATRKDMQLALSATISLINFIGILEDKM